MDNITVSAAESQLILLLSKINHGPSALEETTKLLASPVDWEKIISAARRHEVMPLLYHNLNKLGLQKNIPERTYETLKNSYYYNMRRNLLIWEELASLIKVFNEKDICILALKGGILMEKLYPHLALRTISDIDVLAKPKDIPAIKEILLRLGYKESAKNYSNRSRRISFDFLKEIKGGVNFFLEVHDSIAGARPHKIILPLWERKQESVINGAKINYLSWEDMFLLAALHLRRHTRALSLKFIVDVDLFLSKPFDWSYIQGAARNNHIRNTVYLALYITRELFATPLPQEMENKFRPGLFTRRAIRRILNRGNFLSANNRQGAILRLLLFDEMKDIFMYFRNFSFGRTPTY